jgi:hypothetical protein
MATKATERFEAGELVVFGKPLRLDGDPDARTSA